MVLLLPCAGPVPPLDQPVIMNRNSIQANGLQAWWPTLGSRGSGKLVDASRHGYDGTLTSGPSWLADRMLGSVIDFDNTDDYVDLGNGTTILTTATPFTLCWWELVKASTGTYGSRFRLPVAGGGEAFLVLRSDNQNYTALDFSVGSSAGTVLVATNAPTVAASVGIWHHFAIVGLVGPENHIAANWAAYADAVSLSIGANASYSGIGNTVARIGFDGTDMPANCSMADIRIYNRPISPAEAWKLWAPQTRWELYAPVRQRVFYSISSAAPQSLLPSSIASLEFAGSHRLNLRTTAPGIAGPEAVGQGLVRGQNSVIPTGSPTLELLGSSKVKSEKTITPAGPQSLEQLGSALLRLRMFLAGIGSLESSGSLSLHNLNTILVPGAQSLERLGSPTLNLRIFDGIIASLERAGVPVVNVIISGTQTLTPPGIVSVQLLGTILVLPGMRILHPAGIQTLESLGGDFTIIQTGSHFFEIFRIIRLVTHQAPEPAGSYVTLGAARRTIVVELGE